MGKIYDALEKYQESNQNTVAKSKGSIAEYYASREGAQDGVDLLKPLKEPMPVDSRLVTFLKPRSIESEMFKILRGNLLFPKSGKPPRSMMITSAVPGEGKTFVSANLAVSIAQNINEHVLLMDCDIRKPSIHTMLGLDEGPGLAEYLTNGLDLSKLLVRTGIEKLTILPGGNPPPNPAELLSSQKMSLLLEEVKSRYQDRYIIIDSPPPQLTAEANAIARQVDGIIIVVKYGGTPRAMVEEMVGVLGKEKIVGCVMNWFDLRSSGYFAYGKYGGYSKYYGKKSSR